MRSMLSIGISLAIAGASVLYLVLFVFSGDVESIEDARAQELAPRVTVEILQAQEVIDSRVLTGRILAWEAVTHSAERNGKIEWFGPKEGDQVSAGDELVRVNMKKSQARLAQAQADFRLADQELTRIEGLRGGGISSPREFDQARAAREASFAALELAKIEMDQSVIRSQFDGIVDYRYREAGEYVREGEPLVRVMQVDRVLFTTGAPERDVPHFNEGDPVLVYVDAYPGERFFGTIHQISTSANPATLTFVSEIEIQNADGRLRPGMLAKGVFVKKRHLDAITVPLFAVMREGDKQFVFVETDGIAEKREIEVGFFEGEHILVTAGLEPGERLVVVGQRKLADGVAVEVHDAFDQQPIRVNNPFEAR